jgi:hypothetical protein
MAAASGGTRFSSCYLSYYALSDTQVNWDKVNKMDRAANPFAPGAGNQPPELTGRTLVLEETKITLKRLQRRMPDRSQILIGLRGVGKTVLLNRIDKIARDYGFYSALLEAPEGKRLAEILAPEMRRLLLQLDTLEGAKEKVKRGLGALRAFASAFQVTIGDVGFGISAPAGIADSGNFSRDLTDMLVVLGEAAVDKNSLVAILIDELQYVSEDDLGSLIAALHRVSQLNLPLVLFGVGLPQLAGLLGEAKSYAERLFVVSEIGPLKREDAIKALEDPVERVGVRFTPDALEEVLRATAGYPYFLQEWGKHAWIKAQTSPIGADDVIAATPDAIQELDKSFFRIRFDRLTPTERDYLRAMAELGPQPHRSGDIALAMGRPVEQVAPIRAKVIIKGMAYAPAHGDTAFTVPMFDEYMRRVIPIFSPRPPRSRKQRSG